MQAITPIEGRVEVLADAAPDVAVVGGGAMGGMLGARIAASGQAVLIVDIASSVVDAVAKYGLTLETADGAISTHPAATTDPAGSAPAKFLFILVKGHQTSAATRLAEPLIGAATTVVTLQNGWGNAGEIAERVAPEQLVIGVTYTSATLLGPAHVRAGPSGPTYLGPYDESAGRGRSEAVARLMLETGLPATVAPDIRLEVWRKLVLNAATLPAAALTGLRAGDLTRYEPMRKLVESLAGEVVAVARAQGLDIELDERLDQIHATLERAGVGKPSMLQDVEARRETEIERINGAVVAAAEEVGVPVPLNRAMVALIRGHERSWAP